VHIDEVASFSEVAACGTAVVLTPVSTLTYKDKVPYLREALAAMLTILYVFACFVFS